MSAGSSMHIKGDLVFNGDTNKWIIHTPDDGRKAMYIAPGKSGGGWNWGKQVIHHNTGTMDIGGWLVGVTGNHFVMQPNSHNNRHLFDPGANAHHMRRNTNDWKIHPSS